MSKATMADATTMAKSDKSSKTHITAVAPYGPDSKTEGLSSDMREIVQDQARLVRESGKEGLVLVSTNTVDVGALYMAQLSERKAVPTEHGLVPKPKALQLQGAQLSVIVSGTIRPSDDPRAGTDPLFGRLLRQKPNEFWFRLDSPTHLPFFIECSFSFDPEKKEPERLGLLACQGRADPEPFFTTGRSATLVSFPMMSSVSLAFSADGQWIVLKDLKNPWFYVEMWIPQWMFLRRSGRVMEKSSEM